MNTITQTNEFLLQSIIDDFREENCLIYADFLEEQGDSTSSGWRWIGEHGRIPSRVDFVPRGTTISLSIWYWYNPSYNVWKGYPRGRNFIPKSTLELMESDQGIVLPVDQSYHKAVLEYNRVYVTPQNAYLALAEAVSKDVTLTRSK